MFRPERPRDELAEYLGGASELSRRYRREAASSPPHSLDRRVLAAARGARKASPVLAPWAFAASVLLSLAMISAWVVGPAHPAPHADGAPRVVRAALRGEAALPLYSSDPRSRSPAAWLGRIEALKRAGRGREADAEYRRFLAAYPHYFR